MSAKVLIVDIGNTATELAVIEDGKVLDFLGFFKIPSEISALKNTLISCKKQDLFFEEAMIFSVVPKCNEIVQNTIKEIFGKDVSVFDWGKYELQNKNEAIKESIGADLLGDIVQGPKEYGAPCLIADFGTMTKLLYIDKNSSFEGLSIAPGLETMIKNFSANTALLPELKNLEVTKDRLGLNTAESMYHGAYYSTVYYVKDVLKSLGLSEKQLIITGGNLRYIRDEFPNSIIDGLLTLKGMYQLYEEVKKNEL